MRIREFEDKVWGKPCAVIPRGLAEGGAAPVRSPAFKPKLDSSVEEKAQTPRAKGRPEVGASG